MADFETPQKLMATRAVRQACGKISDMTLYRRQEKKLLPRPVYINGRRYWPESVIS